jgi:hypothetical protein
MRASGRNPWKNPAAVVRAGRVAYIKGTYLEHLSRALRVTRGDDGRMDIHEIPLLEEPMYRVCRYGTYTENCLEGIRPGTQVRDGAQIFH